MRLANKVALITGAGSGMGRLAAQMFAAEGAHVVAADVSEDVLEETVATVHEEGGSIVGVPADVTSGAGVEKLVAAGGPAVGKLDVLYHNAGILPHHDTARID